MDDRQKNYLKSLLKGDGIMRSSQQILKFLEEENLLITMTLKPESLGVHEGNRNGLGIDLSHMGELISNIARMGYLDDHGSRIALELDSSPGSEKTRIDLCFATL